MQCSPAMVARRLVQNMLWQSWARSLFALTGLDRRFLISADHPGAIFQQDMGLFIELQHGASTLQKRFRVLDVLPGMEAPGADLLRSEPPSNRSGRNGGQGRNCGH